MLDMNIFSVYKEETSRKRRAASDSQVDIPSKQICKNGESHYTLITIILYNHFLQRHLRYLPLSHFTGSRLVKEKQLMTVARNFGRSWREIGRLALNVPSVKLEQLEEDHSLHVERVFAMLRYWRACQRENATAAHLHYLLSQDDWALPPESIDLLLEKD